jgi:uncharacterized protein (TIGR02646 family)
MIALTRIRTASAIKAKYRGADKKEMDKKIMKAYRDFLIDPKKKIEFQTAYWTAAKTQLKKETHGKCAYCEANTDVVAHGDVEHYRPKSIYWWLAYTYDNYLFCCQICNQTYKSDNFPYKATMVPSPLLTTTTTDTEIENLAGKISPDPIDITLDFTLLRYTTEHHAENVSLINPYFDNPELFFKYEADDILEEVKMVSSSALYNDHIKAAEDYYGLNRIELRRIRYSVFSMFRVFKKSYSAVTNPTVKRDIQKQLDLMMSEKHIFSGMNRYFNSIL